MARKRKNTCAVAVDRQLEMSARQTDRLASETPEQRQIRLQSMSASNAVRLASEPDTRAAADSVAKYVSKQCSSCCLDSEKIFILRHKRSSDFMNTIIMSTVVKIFFFVLMGDTIDHSTQYN